jgi:hypothetical protein
MDGGRERGREREEWTDRGREGGRESVRGERGVGGERWRKGDGEGSVATRRHLASKFIRREIIGERLGLDDTIDSIAKYSI